MINKSTVERLVEEAIDENEELFLIDLKISPDNKIIVTVDGDKGISVKECIRISRHIEHNLDRDEIDFSLDVTSPGISEPLVNKRQYQKNLGRTVKVKTENESFEGKLTKIDDEEIMLEWKVREPKPIGKGKITVVKTAVIAYKNIELAKVKINF